MYWQVYLHKTVLSAENTLIKILKRAKDLIQKGEPLSSSKSLELFLKKNYNLNDFTKNQELLEVFWNIHDPTTLNRQGPDVGTQYRSAIFYHSQEQERLAKKSFICKSAFVQPRTNLPKFR